MKIKKGDKVIVITGKNSGKVATVVRAFPARERVLIEGVNIAKVHERARGNKKGSVVERALPIHVSNVMLVDAKTGKGTRKRTK